MSSASEKPLVYLETSFISYLTARFSSDEKLARQQLATRRWWEDEGPKCRLIVSSAVLEESARGNMEQAKRRMELLQGIPCVLPSAESRRLTELLLEAHALPPNSSTDAAHVALASVAGADILLTWNCRHIANPITLPKTVEAVLRAGYKCPALATPAQILEASE